MEIQLYQINLSRDEKEVCFMGQDYLERTQPQPRVIDSGIYDLVFQGEVDCTDLEGVYHMFNHSFPPDYTGRSMSVSDVVVQTGADGTKTAHFCDAVGFVDVEFDVTKPKVREQELTVVLLEPGKLADVLLGKARVSLTAGQSAYLDALLRRCSEYLRQNVGVKSVLSLIAVDGIAQEQGG